MTGETAFIAWHNLPELKAETVARMEAHREAERFVQGNYSNYHSPDSPSFRGCAVGCLLGGDDNHAQYEKQFGIPRRVAYLHDHIFERLSLRDAARFAVEFLEAIPVGADLSDVTDQIIGWMTEGVAEYIKPGQPENQPVYDAIKAVREHYNRAHRLSIEESEGLLDALSEIHGFTYPIAFLNVALKIAVLRNEYWALHYIGDLITAFTHLDWIEGEIRRDNLEKTRLRASRIADELFRLFAQAPLFKPDDQR